MIGRIVGFLVGVAIALTGYGLLKPELFARYVDFTRLSLGPFAEYKVVVCWLIVAFGAVVALASLQRPIDGGRRKPASAPAAAAAGDQASAASHGPLNLGPEPEDEPADDPLDPDEAHAGNRAHQPIVNDAASPSRRTPSPLW